MNYYAQFNMSYLKKMLHEVVLVYMEHACLAVKSELETAVTTAGEMDHIESYLSVMYY